MDTIIEMLAQRQGKPLFLCDFSPPKGADLSTIEQMKAVGADCVSVAYSPGKAVRVDPAVVAHLIRQGGGKEVMFSMACRDMNKLAIQNHLLGAQLLGVDNVLILQGDRFTERDTALMKEVNDFTPTGLIKAIAAMNEGTDFRGTNLRAPTAFCIGATIDLGRDPMEREVALATRKVEAGADFFITQTFFDVGMPKRFLEAYHTHTGTMFPRPIFYGLQILVQDGLIFGDVPEATRRELEQGKPGAEIALEQLRSYVDNGLTNVYLVPPILRGGRRDYAAAQQLLEAFRR